MSLAVITKDSAERLGSVFEETLRSSLHVPYDVFILVDDSSTDRTRNAVRRFCQEHGKELIVEKSRLYGGADKPTRATARQTAIDIFLENTYGEYIFFLDDDFVLSQGWWGEFQAKKREYEERSIAWGIAWGINWDAVSDRAEWLDVLGINYKQYLISAFYRRGGTHDTLIPRSVLKEAQDAYGPIPPELHVYEDAWIWWAVRCLGYQAIIIENSGVHKNPFKFSLRSELNRWRLAVETAYKYGITEDANFFARDPLWKQILGLARPVAGLPLALYLNIKAYGLGEGVRRAFVRQALKLLWRAYNIHVRIKLGDNIPTPCEGLARAWARS